MKLLLLFCCIMACLPCHADSEIESGDSYMSNPSVLAAIEFGDSFVKSILECKTYNKVADKVSVLPKLRQPQKAYIISSCLDKLYDKTSISRISVASTNKFDLSFAGGRCLWLVSHIIDSPMPEAHIETDENAIGKIWNDLFEMTEEWSKTNRMKLAHDFISRLDSSEKFKHASDKKTPTEIMELLAKDSDPQIRTASLLNPGVSDKTICKMSRSDPDNEVRTKAYEASLSAKSDSFEFIINNIEWTHY